MTEPVFTQTQITLDKIARNPEQPRRHFDRESLVELARSIRAAGLVQPIVVQAAYKMYLLVDGERRWRASLALAVAQHRNPGDDNTLSVFIGYVLEDVDKFIELHRAVLAETPIAAVVNSERVADTRLLIRSTVANLHRADLNDIELADAYQKMSDAGMSDEEIAQAVGKSRPVVANTRRLMKLPPDMQKAIADGVISTRVALAYLPAMNIKPHLIGEAGLNNQPNFPRYGAVPTPAALRKRLINPEMYGGSFTSDEVRRLVENIVDRCTAIPCVDCGRNTKAVINHKMDDGVVCDDCWHKRKRLETHTRWCPNCRHEKIMNGLEIANFKTTTCDKCGKSYSGYDWRKDPPIDHSKIEYRPLVLEDDAPPIDKTGVIAVTRYCPECGTSRVLETSRIKKGLRSNCANCHAIHPADEWLTELTPLQAAGLAINGKPTDKSGYQPPDEQHVESKTGQAWLLTTPYDPWQCSECKKYYPQQSGKAAYARMTDHGMEIICVDHRLDKMLGKYASCDCHNCGEHKIIIDPKTNTVECEACGENWDSISVYHAEREYYTKNQQPEATTTTDGSGDKAKCPFCGDDLVTGDYDTYCLTCGKTPTSAHKTIELTCDYQLLEHAGNLNNPDSFSNGRVKEVLELPNGMTAIPFSAVSQYHKFLSVELCECVPAEKWTGEKHDEYLRNIRNGHTGFVVRDKSQNVWVLTGQTIRLTAETTPDPTEPKFIPGACPACGFLKEITEKSVANDYGQQCPNCGSTNPSTLWASEAAPPIDDTEAQPLPANGNIRAAETVAEAQFRHSVEIRFSRMVKIATQSQLHELSAWLDDVEDEIFTEATA